ncbi:MAG: glycosyltransferase, partial [Methyloligellaceae bacterium]
PDIIVYHAKAHAAPHIAEALQAVAVPSFQIPGFVPTGAFPSPFLPVSGLGQFGNWLSHKALLGLMSLFTSRMINDWRRTELGLIHARRENVFSGYAPAGRPSRRLHGYSRHIVPVPADWGEREQVTGYWFLDQATDWRPPEALKCFLANGPPPVYVGFGSMPAEDSERLTRQVQSALESTGQRGVLATGWGGLDATANSDRVHVLDVAPHDWLFPKCAAVVHHGGAGTTHEALRWGRPSIICPVFGDQPFWGRRVAELGAGPRPLLQKRLTAAALAEALEAVKSPAIVSRAAEIGVAIREEPGAEGAATAIDGMAVVQ